MGGAAPAPERHPMTTTDMPSWISVGAPVVALRNEGFGRITSFFETTVATVAAKSFTIAYSGDRIRLSDMSGPRHEYGFHGSYRYRVVHPAHPAVALAREATRRSRRRDHLRGLFKDAAPAFHDDGLPDAEMTDKLRKSANMITLVRELEPLPSDFTAIGLDLGVTAEPTDRLSHLLWDVKPGGFTLSPALCGTRVRHLTANSGLPLCSACAAARDIVAADDKL